MSQQTSGSITVDVRGLPVHVTKEGEGPALVLLHGWPGDHRLLHHHLEPLFVGRPSWRRLYIDMPGMGRTPGAEWIHGQADVRDVVLQTIDGLIGSEERFALAGVSYGGFMALYALERCLPRVEGLFLWTPSVTWDPQAHHGVQHRLFERDPGILETLLPDEQLWPQIAVVQNHQVLGGFRTVVKPALALADRKFLRRLAEGDPEPIDPTHFVGVLDAPTLILAARYDTAVGFARAVELADRFPRGTFAVLDRAGHAVAEERKPVFRALVTDWLERVELERESG